MAPRLPRGESDLDALVQQAPLIIAGRIRKVRAATMPTVPVSDDVAVVTVSDVFRAPPMFADLKGKDVTIKLRSARGASPGQSAVFFATAWMYGDGLAVVEVGRSAGRGGAGAMRRDIADAEVRNADRQLARRLAGADFVLVGRVLATRSLREPGRGLISEHDPDWWEATLAVESAEKGRPERAEVTLLYPDSTDEMWIDAPKAQVGQHGIWILRREHEKGPPVMRRPGLTALDPLDVQPAHQLGRIRALIKRGA